MSDKKSTHQNAWVCRNAQSGAWVNSSREMVTKVREESRRDLEVLRQYSLVNGGSAKKD